MSELPSIRPPLQPPPAAVSQKKLASGPPSAIQSRPSLGTKGKKIWLYSNFFPVQFSQKTIYQYDVAIAPTASRAGKRTIFEKFKDEFAREVAPPMAPAVRRSVYDGEKLMFSYAKLPKIDGSREWTINVIPEGDRVKVFTVKIQYTAEVDLGLLVPFLNWNGVGNQPDVPRACFQVLEVLLRHMSSLTFLPVGRNSFYPPDIVGKYIKGGLTVSLGWFQSVRAGHQTLLLNLDQTATSFYESETVDKVIAHFFDQPDIRSTWRRLDRRSIEAVTNFLRLVKVTTTYQTKGGVRATYSIQAIDNVPATERQLPLEEGAAAGAPQQTVSQYYLSHYNIRLQIPEVPCIVIGVQRKRYIPMELLVVKGNQRHIGQLKPEQLAEMIRITSTNPRERFQRVLNGRQQLLNPERTAFVNDWDVNVDYRLLQVPARILDAPRLAVGGNRIVQPRDGGWNADFFALSPTAPLSAWAFVIIDASMRDFEKESIPNFRARLVERLVAKGMRIANRSPPITNGTHPGADSNIRRLLLDAGKSAISSSGSKRPELLICILSKKNHPKYAEIKRVAETNLGVVTQCISVQNLTKDRGLDKYIDNVSLKINAKLGGINSALAGGPGADMPEILTKSPTMFMGADVTHPPPGVRGPSIASLVGSIDRRFSRYVPVIKSQPSGSEAITELSSCVEELLKAFSDSTQNKIFPKNVVFYRDGLSEGQFLEVMATEVRGFKQAVQRLNIPHEVKVTYIVVTKRHHARMFPVSPNDGDRKNNNCLPGTTVDTHITHPFAYDYYQYGSQGLLGTSRPAHYHILYDEIGFTADMIQDVSFKLSHLYARCNRSISLPAPAAYAHLVAGRAKHYQEFVAEGAEEAINIRTLLPAMKGQMFFV